MKNALFVAPEPAPDFLVLVHICSHPLNGHQERKTLLEREELLPLDGEGPEPIVLPWKCHEGHAMELCDEYSNCTKFQFST